VSLCVRLTAYVSALHEHCAGLLEQDGPQQCEDSTRCQLLPANGEVGRASLSGSSTSTNGHPEANFLTSSNSNSSSMATAADPAYWKFVASSLKLQHLACLPIPAQLDSSRSQACRPQQAAAAGAGHSAAAAFPASTGLQQYTKMCEGNPSACLVSNASIAAHMAAWWTGQGPQVGLLAVLRVLSLSGLSGVLDTLVAACKMQCCSAGSWPTASTWTHAVLPVPCVVV